MAKAKKRPAVRRAEPAGPFYQPFAAIGRAPKKAPGARAAPPPPPPKPEPALEPDAEADAESFARYMAGVRALDEGKERIPRSQAGLARGKRELPPAVDPDDSARSSLRSLVAEGIRFEVTDDGERVEGRRLDVDPRDLRRLRRGQFAIDAKLDLHGHTAALARDALEDFLKKRRAEGDRVVVVVHGKGRHSPRGSAVLRGEIAAWLSQGRAARDVAAFASTGEVRPAPTSRDDVPGAVLVLLAR